MIPLCLAFFAFRFALFTSVGKTYSPDPAMAGSWILDPALAGSGQMPMLRFPYSRLIPRRTHLRCSQYSKPKITSQTAAPWPD